MLKMLTDRNISLLRGIFLSLVFSARLSPARTPCLSRLVWIDEIGTP